MFAAEFGEGLSIAARERIAALIEDLALDPDAVIAEAESDVNKARLKSECARAFEIGIFGAPSLVAHDGEPFGATTGSNRGSTGRRAEAPWGGDPHAECRGFACRRPRRRCPWSEAIVIEAGQGSQAAPGGEGVARMDVGDGAADDEPWRIRHCEAGDGEGLLSERRSARGSGNQHPVLDGFALTTEIPHHSPSRADGTRSRRTASKEFDGRFER